MIRSPPYAARPVPSLFCATIGSPWQPWNSSSLGDATELYSRHCGANPGSGLLITRP